VAVIKAFKWRGLWVDIPPSGNCTEDAPVTMPVEVGTDIANILCSMSSARCQLTGQLGDDLEQ